MTLPESVLVKNQKRVYGPRFYHEGDREYKITVTVRYDDQCGNGHNSFSITADIRTSSGVEVAGGCCHDEVAKHFPELAPFIKWHLTSSDGPMHYIANTSYWAGKNPEWCNGKTGSPPNLNFARSCAVWPDATDAELTEPGLEQRLAARLPALMAQFKSAVESLGFTY